ncbi:HD domain-containing protein [Clostridium sp.]|uniref:HD domain-containing protein n=1 Tax=Clostridium sp. TaxID=1506 RepID=UPI003F353B3C
MVNQYEPKEVLCKFYNSSEYEVYKKYKGYISEKNYFNSNGIHGVKHIERVLILSMVISMLIGLNTEEVDLLAMASVFHDIGRKSDGTDRNHGRNSVIKLHSLDIYKEKIEKNFDGTKLNILDFVIIGHVMDDSKALIYLEKSNIKDKILGEKLLKYFKDADALDRVRANDLDLNFLRNSNSKKLVEFAKYLFKII